MVLFAPLLPPPSNALVPHALLSRPVEPCDSQLWTPDADAVRCGCSEGRHGRTDSSSGNAEMRWNCVETSWLTTGAASCCSCESARPLEVVVQDNAHCHLCWTPCACLRGVSIPPFRCYEAVKRKGNRCRGRSNVGRVMRSSSSTSSREWCVGAPRG